SDKTILVGARIPIPSHDAVPTRYDFSADLAALGGERLPMFSTADSRAGHRTKTGFPYDKVLIVRGAETGAFPSADSGSHWHVEPSEGNDGASPPQWLRGYRSSWAARGRPDLL